MLRKITARLLHEWMEFYSLEPFGREADDAGTAIVAMLVAALRARDGKRLNAQDFMPFTDDRGDADSLIRKALQEHRDGKERRVFEGDSDPR